ncbi:tRNA 5-methoxyuridine(34)/uridine 5-oxyacetic acid(34) synthase CmoB [Thorsellia anophelis]|uniref:tRNA U34 carboxymethyltransferase n=1 Tax=Thorsellia anophelis DSM 18579 TaxID=1123402 RepID=A0A1I0DH18_9GAMM|nr:tRNA 5-methoxyuridine(34)/uridine 5-oxyacetic acid(34) synthase CmoB [Thorsellia anophelis]SET31726.1 tRNA (mo5U34)-methyltransferase [Thorsellia anophelis DSM 18579]
MSITTTQLIEQQYKTLYQHLASSHLSHWLETLPAQLALWIQNNPATLLNSPNYKWHKAIENMPLIEPNEIEFKDSVSVKGTTPLSEGQIKGLMHQLKTLMPWRKGPFSLHGIDIDTEWRSDFKWNRLIQHISPLKDRWVLDVGCGSGYHLWRMLGEGAHTAIGIDPTELFLCQFMAVRKLLNHPFNAFHLPIGIEMLPELNAFDTVFSMGVLYHRRSALDHLLQLKNQLRSGGELVLETLVIEGDATKILVPHNRYAQMSNVYFIPSCDALILWLEKMGFTEIQLVDKTITTFEEQRKTDWMQNESLQDFLDPNNSSLTIEGYPAPLRAVFIAKKP